MGNSEKDNGPYSTSSVEAGLDDSRETLEVKPLKSWKGYLWDTWELPPDQRWLLFKLDAFVLTFASVRTLTIRHQFFMSNASCDESNKIMYRLGTFSKTWT